MIDCFNWPSSQCFFVVVSTLTVDGIINKWENQLRKDVEEYQRQSERVAMWDQQLRENQKMLNGLMDSVHRILADQEDLDGCIEAIEAYQRELDTELDSLSQDVDKYIETVQLEPDEGTYSREQIYSLAIDLDQHLTAVSSSSFSHSTTLISPLFHSILLLPHNPCWQINENLDKIIEGYNEGKNNLLTSSNTSNNNSGNKIVKVNFVVNILVVIVDQINSILVQILKILNTHQDSLTWIDSKSK